ncbi:ABC transporter permease [Actinoallomurus vinaceus]|uniref:ABC transporter permease n=1 Tax=Actinoallomurus vinaceus TaxID=1080074 RepID=A0ABP8UJI7_9ACTN
MLAEPATATAVPTVQEQNAGRPRRAALRHLLIPAALAAVLAALYLWVSGQRLDSIERRTLNSDYIIARVVEHLRLTGLAVLLVVVIAIPLGVLLSRPAARWLSPFVLGLANLGQATPAIGLLVLLTIKFGVGFRIALIGLVAYAVLPVLRNTMVGVQQVDRSLVEAARGMGMTRAQVLIRVELKLAIPVILAGLRTSLVMAVGVATLATFVNAGGLGDIIVNGIKLNRTPVLLTGSVLTACIALLIDWLGGVAEDALRPKGV